MDAEMDRRRNERMQRNVIENDFLAEDYSQAAAGRPHRRPNPSSLFTGLNESGFDIELQEKPTRDANTAQGRQTGTFGGTERHQISIDENDDTVHNKADLEKILRKGKRLQTRMDEALGDDAWEQLHGNNERPKQYVPPFLRDAAPKKPKDFAQREQERMDNLYSIEIEAGFDNGKGKKDSSLPRGEPSGNRVTFAHDDERQEMQPDQIQFGGNGGDLTDMRFIRMKIKSLVIEDATVLQEIHGQAEGSKFGLNVSLPLPDVYKKTIVNQTVSLSNYSVVATNEFEFTSLTLYNFMVSEDTFNKLSAAELKVSINEQPIEGKVKMNKLLMAPKFKLALQVPLTKTVIIASKQSQKTAEQKKEEVLQSKKGRKSMAQLKADQAKKAKESQEQKIETHVGYVEIEMNLQRGDTEEELERNYQLKLKHQEQVRNQQAELEMMEKRKRAMMMMEEQPTFAQLYLHVANLGRGGIFFDREGVQVEGIDDLQREDPSASEREGENDKPAERVRVDLNLPERNLYVSYKAFPSLEKLITSVMYGQSEPYFNYRSQFPVLMTPDIIDRLEKFTFVLEVWDEVSPSRHDLVGLVKIPLASFCYSMRTTEDDIFSLNFLAEQHNIYPMVITDENLPIYSPKHGQNVGHLKVLLALGTPSQVNRQIQKESELERTRMERTLAEEKARMQNRLLRDIQGGNSAPQKEEQEKKMKDLIEKNNAKRDREEEARAEESHAKSPFGSLFGLPARQSQSFEKNPAANKFANALRQSLQLSPSKKDYDLRDNSFLHAMRKLFEEMRAAEDLNDFTSEDLFEDEAKGFDGSVQKDEFIYTILNKEEFTLTRTEVSNVCSLLLNISFKDDKEKIDLEQLQYSYSSYLKYYELIEARVIDLLEKFKLSISKKLETPQEVDNLVSAIDLHSDNSKVTIKDLKLELEDRRGIIIRDTLYDQLASYFDLDRSGQIYITSFCSYLTDNTVAHFNFFKLNPSVMTGHIVDYLRNCLTAKPELLKTLEGELKKEIFWKTREQQRVEAGLEGKDPKDPREILQDDDLVELDENGAPVHQEDEKKKKKKKRQDPNEPPSDLLLNEQVNAKLLQFKLKRLGIAVSLWEIFSLFDFVNMRFPKMAYEPQRYQNVMFENLYKSMTSADYKADLLEIDLKPVVDKKEKKEKTVAKVLDSEGEEEEPVKPEEPESSKQSSESSERDSQSESDSDLDADSLCDSELSHRRLKRRDAKLSKMTYHQVKHVFSIDIKGLKNIPVLAKFIKDAKDLQAATLNSHYKEEDVEDEDFVSSSYIQNVAVKYSFPLDEDEILESDYIKKVQDKSAPSQSANYDYSVSMNTVHTYLMPKEDKIEDIMSANKSLATTNAQSTNLFNLSVALYSDNREFVIGNAQLPMEDLADLVRDHDDRQRSYVRKDQKAVLNRVLFLYGTSYSQRANCIIGKLALEISYQAMPQYLTKREARDFKREQKLIQKGLRGPNSYTSCFMHRETYINRKIPLNALLSLHIDKVTNLKESIENIEHFARINQSAFDGTVEARNDTQVDRRRILTQILKNGMNLVVLSSLFDEDTELTSRFPDSKQTSRMLYNSLNPIYQETYSIQVQMDTKIFDYLKTKRAVFEVRHYIQQASGFNDRATSGVDALDDANAMEGRDFLTLGYVRVPLLHLITKNNGIDGDFVILDEYKQKMGALSLRIALNHHNTQRPLFAGSTRQPSQVSVNKPPSGGVGTDFAHTGIQAMTGQVQKPEPALTSTLIDKSVSMRNSMDFNRAGQVTSSGLDFNSRATTNNYLSQSIHKTVRPQKGHQQILALSFVEVVLADRQKLLDFSYDMGSKGKASLLFLKFKFLGQTYHTKFISLNENQLDRTGGVQQIQSAQMKSLNLAAFEIKKTILLRLDLSDQATIESAFGCPLEIQLWNRVTSAIPYRQPDSEDLLGSFFVELNELPKTTNLRVKGVRQQKFVCSESYYTLYDQQRDQVSRDRLALKLYLLDNEDEQTMDELDKVFHDTDRAQVDESILRQLDPMAKGYVELEDLQSLIEDKVTDRKIANKLLTMVNENLEFKNSDSVYYSPLFGLPPPYFKQSKSYSTFEFAQQTMRELISLDSHGNGFLPVGLFRSALEHELKIKPKIVDDFIETCKQPAKSLDVNCTANSFQSQLDFIVLIRKIVKLVEIQLQGTQLVSAMTTSKEPEIEKLTLSIDVVSAMRLLNPLNDMEPPNSYVRFRIPQMQGVESEDKEFNTNIINQSCYPCWQSRDHKVHIPLTKDNLDHIMNGTRLLEFDVMHAQFEGFQQTQPSLTLIGTAYVDFSALALDASSKDNALSGYFHIINKGDVRSSKDLSFMETNQMSKQSKGQLKVTVRAESDKHGSAALRSTIMFPSNDSRLTLSLANGTNLMTSQETFGNRMQNQQLYSSMNMTGLSNTGVTAPVAGSAMQSQLDDRSQNVADDDFDVDREQPREEKKFDMINSSNPSYTLTTVNEQQSDFNDTIGALNRDNIVQTFNRVPELGATAKRTDQIATLRSEMQQRGSTETGVFNPFSSSLDEDRQKSPVSQRSKEDQQSFDRE